MEELISLDEQLIELRTVVYESFLEIKVILDKVREKGILDEVEKEVMNWLIHEYTPITCSMQS